MPAFSLSAAKVRLPELVARAEAGEDIVDREWPGRATKTMW
jgi:hypothetical protein